MAGLPDTKSLDLDLTDGWLTIWFNSPEKDRNALTQSRCDDLFAICVVLAGRRGIRGVTFRGRESVFCAGGDLKSFKDAVSGNAKRHKTLETSRAAGALYGAINTLPQITVMAVEGPCVAGGLGIRLSWATSWTLQPKKCCSVAYRIDLAWFCRLDICDSPPGQ